MAEPSLLVKQKLALKINEQINPLGDKWMNNVLFLVNKACNEFKYKFINDEWMKTFKNLFHGTWTKDLNE
jgi:hypothetical protein